MAEEYIVTVEVDRNLRFTDEKGSGFYVREQWTQNSKLHRRFGPAVTIRHPETLQPIREEFYEEGRRHRFRFPALIVRDPSTGDIVELKFYENGRRVVPHDPSAPRGPF
ncbi:MAG TPA: hypothetical protein VF463_19700 [Sphingobium sp.]